MWNQESFHDFKSQMTSIKRQHCGTDRQYYAHESKHPIVLPEYVQIKHLGRVRFTIKN